MMDRSRPYIAFNVGSTWARVVDGTKTVTRRMHPLIVGEIYDASRNGTIVGVVRVTSCEQTTLSDITQAEVDAEGFAGKTPEWLCEVLLAMYRDRLFRFEPMYRIGFELVSVVPSPQGVLPGLEGE